MSLFDAAEAEKRQKAQPLAARMRPATLGEFVDQQHSAVGRGCAAEW